jgi:SAM-dependent methyltransferase
VNAPQPVAPADWIEFWDSKHSIYVSPRHVAAHFRRIAEDIRAYALQGGVMLDYGCGEALSADVVANPAAQLILSEPAPKVRAALAARFACNAKIVVRTPDEVAAMATQSIDVIVMHSVTQYLTGAELDSLLALFHRLLRPGGLLVIGDVIPRHLRALDDAMELLRFAADEGFQLAALAGLARTYFSSYWQLRQALGLSRYDPNEIAVKLKTGHFSAEQAATNIGHNAKRMTFLAHAL